MAGKLVAIRLPSRSAADFRLASSGTQMANRQRPTPSLMRTSALPPDSSKRSLPVIPMSIAPSAHRVGISSVRRKINSTGRPLTRAKSPRLCRRKLNPACFSRSPAMSLRRPLLGKPNRKFFPESKVFTHSQRMMISSHCQHHGLLFQPVPRFPHDEPTPGRSLADQHPAKPARPWCDRADPPLRR